MELKNQFDSSHTESIQVLSENGSSHEIDLRFRWLFGNVTNEDIFFGKDQDGHAECFGRIACGNHEADHVSGLYRAVDIIKAFDSMENIPSQEASIYEIIEARKAELKLHA